MIDRRAVIGGLTAAVAAGVPALAAKAPPPPPETPLFTSSALTRNAIASQFTVPRKALALHKYTRLLDPSGKKTTLEAYRGKLLLVSLWAEWCTPCLVELPGIAYHRRRSSTDKFELLPICTGTNMFDRPSQIDPALKKINVEGLDSLLDVSDDDHRLIDTVCKDPDHPKAPGAIPCMLVIDPEGQIRGHLVGGPQVQLQAGQGAGQVVNAWLTTVSQQFLAILGKGDVELAPLA
jgi:thiol-disulfide isomerase/thioredoxin